MFTSPTGDPVSRFTMSRAFARMLQRAGLPHIRFHDLRHAAATYMLGEGVELKVVQQVLGHSQIGVTANTYAHVVPALQRSAAARKRGLGGFLSWVVVNLVVKRPSYLPNEASV